MADVGFGAAAAGKGTVLGAKLLHGIAHRLAWRWRLARSVVKAASAGHLTSRSARHLKRSVRRALTEQPVEDSLRKRDQSGMETTNAILMPRLRDQLKAIYGDQWEPHLHEISRLLRDHYFDARLTPQVAIRLAHEGIQTDGADGHDVRQPALPPIVITNLRDLSEGGETVVANSLRQWMADSANRRSGAISELVGGPEGTSPLLAEASYLAWEAVGLFVSAYDLGNPYPAYRQASLRGSPRRILYEADEALKRFDGSNFAEVGRMLDHLPQDHAFVCVARAFVEGDMRLAMERLEQGTVCESDDPTTARSGKFIRIAALANSGQTDRAIERAREAIREYPDLSSWRIRCADLLAFAAQEETSNDARKKRLGEEGLKLALEARDMIREWQGPSGPAVSTAVVCAHLLRDPNEACRLAMEPPDGEALEREANHPAVIPHLAMALGILGRFDELRELDTSNLSEFYRTIIAAWIARHDNEPDAVDLMRQALDLAVGQVEISMARYGLASLGGFGDINADDQEHQHPSEAALLGSLVADQRGDHELALTSIRAFRWHSVDHAMQYAHVLVVRGEVDSAVAHLQEAARRFTAPDLVHCAAEILMGESRFDDAEPLVASALNVSTNTAYRKALHGHRIEIANQRLNHVEMHQVAETAATEFPDEPQFRWAAIFALCRLGDLEHAYRHLREHPFEAPDRQMQLIEVGLRSRFDQSPETVDWLLELAESALNDEEIVSAVISAIIMSTQEMKVSEHQSNRLGALIGGFLTTFPSSEMFYTVEGTDIESLIGEMRSILESGVTERADMAEKVSLGQMPFGMLQMVSGRPYALLLVGGAASALPAIPPDEDTRRLERAAAAAALNHPVAVDTSSIMLWQRHLGGSPALHGCFSEMLIATELTADLRAAEHMAGTPIVGTMGVHPVTGKMWMSESDPEQTRAIQDAIDGIQSLAASCAYVDSASISEPESERVPSQLAPWDAAFRVALDRNCALWTDDAFMRRLARQYGVPSFGTYALHEALMSTAGVSDLPSSTLR